ncbi:MAG TPA: SpoIVB peptidase [Candidatus Eubacterium faecigallinarum]|nr:SpoIVB peptidase [Candidatus Eubacterium faecigallinarum]
MKKFIRAADACIAVMLIFIYVLVGVGDYSLPDRISTYSSKDISYNSIYKVDVTENSQVDFQNNARVSPSESEIKLLGIIPVKSAQVTHESEQRVYVSGECFGIKLYTDGVIVVGTKDVVTDEGKCNPAKEAGIEKGDIIISINNVKMTSSSQVEETFNDNNGKDYEITVKRNGNYKKFTLTPVYSKSEGRYKVGIWVRDSTAGIGTITFYNPENSSLAALGHPITDVDTNEIMPILNGEAVKANVTKIYKSTDGEAGSLSCDFTNEAIGSLSVNSNCGIYGKYQCALSDKRLYKVANSQEVEKGSAQILCTVDEKGPQLYDVEITRISYRENNDEKNMVVKVTDKNLLEKTGGIVQGMSGSPIIQNGMLVGALTHVIVDNPEKGYAIFAEKMMQQSEEIK